MVESPSVTLFLATPRTGTQWLARSLGHVFEDLALVEHEPADYEYEPRRMLRRDDQRSLLRVPVIDEHFGRIRETLGSGRHYVEVGWIGPEAPRMEASIRTTCLPNPHHLTRGLGVERATALPTAPTADLGQVTANRFVHDPR